MENKFGGSYSKAGSIVVGCLVAVFNGVFAWAFAFGIGMSSQSNIKNAFFLLGVRQDHLPFVFIFSVPASIALLVVFKKGFGLSVGLTVSIVHFVGISWFLLTAWAWPQ